MELVARMLPRLVTEDVLMAKTKVGLSDDLAEMVAKASLLSVRARAIYTDMTDAKLSREQIQLEAHAIRDEVLQAIHQTRQLRISARRALTRIQCRSTSMACGSRGYAITPAPASSPASRLP